MATILFIIGSPVRYIPERVLMITGDAVELQMEKDADTQIVMLIYSIIMENYIPEHRTNHEWTGTLILPLKSK